MPPVLQISNISKIYRLGEISTGTISSDLERWYKMKIRKQEDPYFKIGETNDRSTKGLSDLVYSLRDINFEVQQGEALGIIGKNGAGKSTLLKIISRVTSPTTGKIKIKGRVASLLEVGTGFHPELTGRENIYLNGAILGMRKKEITRKLDEIIDFSGVERYIDTPVKRYSSGMYVRLAFAVAAHLESEILIIDEVLAVGDAEFQKKCLGKMGEVSRGEGRTVIFVSHNLGAVKELCNTAFMLKNGQLTYSGSAKDVVREYLSNPVRITTQNDLLNDKKHRRGNGEVRFTQISINNNKSFIDPSEEIRIKLKGIVNNDVDQIYFSLMLRGPINDDPIVNTGMVCISNNEVKAGSNIEFEISILPNTFRTGLFPLYLWLGKKSELAEENYPYDVVDSVYYLNLNSDKSSKELGYKSDQPGGYLNFKCELEMINIETNIS
ncbi:MAG: ABC transporter ATP-binding protein [Bacteroidetes bacterium]|nr:ABC transporter ATP-binding protein [Bacteroidota bacterium]